MKTYKLTGRAVASYLASPLEEARLKELPPVCVELRCSGMGRRNRDKLTGLLWAAIKAKCEAARVRMGGMTCGAIERLKCQVREGRSIRHRGKALWYACQEFGADPKALCGG